MFVSQWASLLRDSQLTQVSNGPRIAKGKPRWYLTMFFVCLGSEKVWLLIVVIVCSSVGLNIHILSAVGVDWFCFCMRTKDGS